MREGWRHVALGEVLDIEVETVTVEPKAEYNLAGVYSFGRGLFERERLLGVKTNYKVMNRLRPGRLVMSKLKAWEGALAVADHENLRGVAPRVRAVSAVGSGDAFLAGVVLTLSTGGSMTEALRLGIASGTASVLFPGTELCRRREVDILMPRVRVQPIDLSVAC